MTWSDATRAWPGDSDDVRLWRKDVKILCLRIVIVSVAGVVNGRPIGFVTLGSERVRWDNGPSGPVLRGVVGPIPAEHGAMVELARMVLTRLSQL